MCMCTCPSSLLCLCSLFSRHPVGFLTVETLETLRCWQHGTFALTLRRSVCVFLHFLAGLRLIVGSLVDNSCSFLASSIDHLEPNAILLMDWCFVAFVPALAFEGSLFILLDFILGLGLPPLAITWIGLGRCSAWFLQVSVAPFNHESIENDVGGLLDSLPFNSLACFSSGSISLRVFYWCKHFCSVGSHSLFRSISICRRLFWWWSLVLRHRIQFPWFNLLTAAGPSTHANLQHRPLQYSLHSLDREC